MTRVLILYGAAHGKGHKSAANALAVAFQQRGAASAVKVADAFDYGATLYRQLYGTFYRELSENAPVLWEYIYELADDNDNQFVNTMRMLLDRVGVNQLDELIHEFTPDMIVCTHFLPLHILSWYSERGKLDVPLYAVVTDYTGHTYWVCPEVSHYFVPSDTAQSMLVDRGVPAERITLAGIPVDPAIGETSQQDRAMLRAKHELAPAPVVTLIGSGVQVERVMQIVTGVRESDWQGTLILLAGRNADLNEAFQQVSSTDTITVKPMLGFIDYLDELIAASDLVITKAGGLIVTETLAAGVPLVLIDPLRGQEEWNADYVVRVGAGVQLRVIDMVPSVVASLVSDNERLSLLQQRAAATSSADAAHTIADALLAMSPPTPQP